MSVQLSLTSQARLLLGIGAISAMLAVMLGAFGAHALRAKLAPELLAVYQTGVQYHFYHSLGMILVGILAALLPGRAGVMWSGWLMAAGIALFSGSLYALALSGVRILGAITPLGGVAFIASWLTLAISVFRART
jgi:uncharacterized membrane protein YgdD (TMEM256/DUF423 family)